MSFLVRHHSKFSRLLSVMIILMGIIALVIILAEDINSPFVMMILASISLIALYQTMTVNQTAQPIISPQDKNTPESESRFQSLMENINQGLILTDADGIIIFINSQMQKLLALPKHQLYGKTLTQLFSKLKTSYDPDLAQQELRIIRHDGEQLWLELNTTPLSDAQGGWVSICINITDHKQTVATLHERKSHLSSIVTQLPIILFAIDVTGKIILSEGKGLAHIGLAQGELVGQSIWERYKDEPLILEDVKQALRGEFFSMSRQVNDVLLETIYSPLLDANGGIIGTIGVSFDATDRIQADEERERLASIVNHSDDFIAITDMQTQEITYVNQGGVRMAGYKSADELLGQSISRFRKVDKEQVFKTVRSLSKASWREDGELIRADNSLLPVEQTQFIIRDDRGVPYAMATIMSDITERLLTQHALENARDKAIEASALKSEFLATMSHEIRTPMNGIIGMTELLVESNLEGEQHEFATIVLGEAFHLLNLINDILDFAKIEAGEVILEERSFDPHQIVENVHTLLNTNAQKKELNFTAKIMPSIPQQVIGDASRLRQVLINLTGNAIKFTESGSVTITVSISYEDESDITLRFDIEDTGIGVAPENRPRLFQPFTQVDGSHTRKYGGTGLGLVVAKRLVELMDGNIDYSSVEGAGSTFWFTASFRKQPRADAQSDIVITDESSVRSSLPQIDLTGIRVLIVDSDATQAHRIRTQLSKWGIQSQPANSLDNALANLTIAQKKGVPYDLAIVGEDIVKTEDGRFLRALAEDPSASLTRLIYMGNLDNRQAYYTCFANGFATILPTPVKVTRLHNAITTASIVMLPDDFNELQERDEAHFRGLVLIAEDNFANREVSIRQLHRLGYVTHAVENGQDALRLIEANSTAYDLILMDYQMPIMGGLEATRKIRQQEVISNQHIPIIAMTANAHEQDRQTGIETGMDDYIAKPVTLKTLRQVLEKWITHY